MTTLSHSNLEAFRSSLEEAFYNVAADPLLKKLRQKAWDHFLELGLPAPKSDVFRYVPLRKLFARTYTAARKSSLEKAQLTDLIAPECTQSVLVFVNGHYAPELSDLSGLPAKVVVTPLERATRSFGAFLTNQWGKTLLEEADPFATLNAAIHTDGIFVYIPPRLQVEKPLQVLEIMDADDSSCLAMPRFHFFVGSQSELHVLSTHSSLSGGAYWVNQGADFAIEDQASVRYTQVSHSLPQECWLMASTRAYLKKNSRFVAVHTTEGSATTRHDYRVVLNGENAHAELNGTWSLNEKREAHTHVLVDHQSPHCHSFQLFKGILNGSSHSSFEGKILVRQAAQKTNAFQLNNNILLSDIARAESKPNLEIFADDVKASHGATVGQLDKEQLFYLETRGCSPADAKRLLIEGFAQEVFNKISIPSIRQLLAQRMQTFL
ncbi:Fe-S cluster assembly protein SufD [Parachlamydia sp. AcF125]|uniref:Fe-S cluster assembly protein SufD n=1 Tax=Parachlamydia sp. AcF125 TaxID=2795736 RepID=UPI001BCA10E3|nr:Fe-S cluster assembly protein SufD [Parachlamydia sp. AcF125]MBS4168076.1 FeS cluster assembly protein SufD [Parachlamydia sp. AcF125]